MQKQFFYMVWNPEAKEIFFKNFMALMRFWKRDVQVVITQEALQSMKKFQKRGFEEVAFGKMTFKLNLQDEDTKKDKKSKNVKKQKEMIDILYDVESRNTLEISFGPLSDKKKREVFTPYKKGTSRILVVKTADE